MYDVEHIKRTIDCRTVARDLLGEPSKTTGGKNYYCCPFHAEKRASFCVYQNGYYCYGSCQKGGSVIHLVMNKLGKTFTEACAYLGASATHDLPPKAPASPKDIFPACTPPHPHWQRDAKDVVKYAHSLLTDPFGLPAFKYLTSVRQLDPRVIDHAQLGYLPLPNGWRTQQYWEDYATVSAVSGLIFPHFDDTGNLWQVRVRLPKPPRPLPSGKKPDKYSSWTSPYNGKDGKRLGGRLIGSMFLAQHWQPRKPLFVDEGEINALSILTAIMDTALPLIPLAIGSVSNNVISAAWMNRLVFAPKVYLRTDAGSGDRVATKLTSLSKSIIRVQVPAPHKDPNDFLQAEGKNAVLDWLRSLP